MLGYVLATLPLAHSPTLARSTSTAERRKQRREVPRELGSMAPVNQGGHVGAPRLTVAQLDRYRPSWDDTAQGGAADGPPRESPEPPAGGSHRPADRRHRRGGAPRRVD